jgi:hypothetical protein
MPERVIVRKDDLLKVLRLNRDSHYSKFERAFERFRGQALAAMQDNLDQARVGGPVRLTIVMPVPECHTEDYDREIRMLEMHQEDTVEIASRLFDQIVMDRWGWAASYAANTEAYLVSEEPPSPYDAGEFYE